MSIARIGIVAVAFLAAGGAGIVALNLTAAAPPAEPVIISAAPVEPPIKLTDVLVTSTDVAMGARLENSFAWQSWPLDGVGPTFITRDTRPAAMDELKGTIARQSFFAGEPVREAKLIKSDRGFMSAILPSGKRAIAVQISADTSAGGFILPNDHVDVIMSRRKEAPAGAAAGQQSDAFDTETILKNLRVLAIDQTIEEQNGTQVVVGSTATLEVDPAQAEALTTAQQMADRLVLALRSLSDSVPGSSGYASVLDGEVSTSGKIRVVRYGRTTDITTKN
jgi:pilus assembly protein CpaB